MNTPDQDTAAVVGPQRRMLELIYDTFAPIGEWPLFLYISQLWSDPETDPRDIYLDLAARGFVNPVMARTHQFQLKENTNVAVSLQGLMHLRQASEDLSQFVSTVRYVADRAGRFRPPSATELARLCITSEEIRLHLKLELGDPALPRLGALVGQEAWQLFTAFSGPDSDGWAFEVNLERARRYRSIYTVIDFLDISYPEGKQNEPSLPASPTSLGSTQKVPTTDNKKVMVVHGRDMHTRGELFSLLQALSLEPIDWSEAIKSTGKASPYNAEAVEAAFRIAQAAVILLVPEENVLLRPDLRNADELSDGHFAWQARPNVYYEGGIAFTSHPDRTIILQLGQPRLPTDLEGRNAVRISTNSSWRKDLANRLRDAGCPVTTEGPDWLNVGEFAEPDLSAATSESAYTADAQSQTVGSRHNDDEGATPSRVELLRKQFRAGKAIQALPPWHVGPAPESQSESQEGHERRKKAVTAWTEATWRMLAEHFPSQEENFCPANPAAGLQEIWLVIHEELETARHGPDSYLAKKLAFLADLLKRYDA